MAHPRGFEPLTPAFGGQYSIQLSYGCVRIVLTSAGPPRQPVPFVPCDAMASLVLWALAIVAAALFSAFLYAAVAGNRAQDRLIEDRSRRDEGSGSRG